MNNRDKNVVVSDIDFFYGKNQILKKVSLNLKPGEVYGLVGPNGAGKTTLLKIMSGLLKPQSGNVLIGGDQIGPQNVKSYSKIGVQIEDTASYENLSGYENIEILAKMYPNKTGNLKDEILDVLSLVGLSQVAHNKVKTYSLGMKKRLGIAMSLINNPDFLILDEPTNGLDIDGIRLIRKIVKQYSEQTNAAIIISSHNTSELENTCSHIAFLINGEIKSVRAINDFEEESIEDYYIRIKENRDAV